MNEILQSQLTRVQRVALVCAAIGGGGCVIGAIVSARQFFISYLWGYLFWLGLALGCMCLTMIHSLTAGRWGDVTRRFQEAGFMTLPVMLVLFVPIFFGLHELYPWARPAEVAMDPVLQKRAAYMSAGGFIGRTLFYFAVWIVLAWFLRRWSLEQDGTTDLGPTRRMRTLSGPGLVIYPLTATLAYVDWIMSLESRWFSTMFAIIICIGQILSGLSFSIILLTLFRKIAPIGQAMTSFHLYQLGTLLFAFVLFWTYISFGQLLIIYSANLPHEISWYLHRIGGNWKWIVGAIAFFQFFLPFYLMLFRPLKQRFETLTPLAMLLFVMGFVDLFWYVKPTFHPTGISVSWLDFAAPLAVGGVWVAVFIAGLRRHNLMPQNDPRVHAKALVHAH